MYARFLSCFCDSTAYRSSILSRSALDEGDNDGTAVDDDIFPSDVATMRQIGLLLLEFEDGSISLLFICM